MKIVLVDNVIQASGHLLLDISANLYSQTVMLILQIIRLELNGMMN